MLVNTCQRRVCKAHRKDIHVHIHAAIFTYTCTDQSTMPNTHAQYLDSDYCPELNEIRIRCFFPTFLVYALHQLKSISANECIYICMYVCIYVCMYVCMYACIYTCMCVSMCITSLSHFFCASVQMCTFTYIHKYMQACTYHPCVQVHGCEISY